MTSCKFFLFDSTFSCRMEGKPHTPRNSVLPGGISRYGRSAMYSRKALYKKKKVPVLASKKKKPYFRVKEIKGEKNGGKRIVPLKKSVSMLWGDGGDC